MDPVQNPDVLTSTQTTLPNDRTNAEVHEKNGKREVILKGPLSEVLRRALNIIYAKDSQYEGNYSMETAQPDPDSAFDDLAYVVVNTAVTQKDVENLAVLTKAAKEEHKKVSVIILDNKKAEEEPSELLEPLLAIANSSDAEVFEKAEDFFV